MLLPSDVEVELLTELKGPIPLLLMAAISKEYLVLGNKFVAVNCSIVKDTFLVSSLKLMMYPVISLLRSKQSTGLHMIVIEVKLEIVSLNS